MSQTELRRIPLPSKENGIPGIAYLAGEPSAWPFAYPHDLITSMRKDINRYIPADSAWPTHYEVIREFSALELSLLGLEDASPEDRGAYPTEEEAKRMKQGSAALPPSPEDAIEDYLEMIDGADGDWDEEGADLDEDDPQGR